MTSEPKPERTGYEIASVFFAAVVIAFAVAGLLVEGLGDDGPISGGFAICGLFLLLGLGRLYLGLRRPGVAPEAEAEVPHVSPPPHPRRPPPRRRRP